MHNHRVTSQDLNQLQAYSDRQPYSTPWALQPASRQVEAVGLKDQVLRTKVLQSLEDAVRCTGLKDGDTISFHHHFRDGDKTLMQVLAAIRRLGIKGLRIAASSLTRAHEGLVDYIKDGTVTRVESSGLRGRLAEAISDGALGDHPAVIRSHGGRARAIASGEVTIDVAFLAVSSADCLGNANGVHGKNLCGSLGYAMVDAEYARQVVLVTDTLVEYPNYPVSIPQNWVDWVVVVEEIGDPKGIMSGATRFTSNPKELLMAKRVIQAMIASGYFVDGFSMQTGSGGASLAVTRFIREEMLKRNIKASFGLGGISSSFVELLEEGLIGQLFDTQDFDLRAAESLGKNPRHVEVSADFYANPHNGSPAVNRLDFVILSAMEIDTDFNVNVISGSDGIIREASGGHSDTAAAAKCSIVVAPLTRGRLATVVDQVTTMVTPGETVDVVVTDHGIAVNPLRTDLKQRFEAAGLSLVSIQELRRLAVDLVGEPQPIPFEERVVAVIEYRDGSIIDLVRKVKKI